MKFLINKNFKAVFTGEFVQAKSEDEFVFDTESSNLTVGQLNEIASSNNIKITETKKAKVVEQLASGLEKLKLREVTQMSENQIAEEIIIAAHEADKTENETLVELVTAGIQFKHAAKLYNSVRIELGLAVSAADRKKQIADYLATNRPEFKDYEEMLSCVSSLQDTVPGLTTAQAVSGVKKFCKENQIELPKKPRGAGKPKGGLRAQIMEYIIANPESNAAQLEDFVTAKGKDAKIAKRYVPMLEVANAVFKAK